MNKKQFIEEASKLTAGDIVEVTIHHAVKQSFLKHKKRGVFKERDRLVLVIVISNDKEIRLHYLRIEKFDKIE